MQLLHKILGRMANSLDPDQTAVWSGSVLFACSILWETLVYKNFGHVCPIKTQSTLHIHAVWSESLLSIIKKKSWRFGYPKHIQWRLIRLLGLIWVFLWVHMLKVYFLALQIILEYMGLGWVGICVVFSQYIARSAFICLYLLVYLFLSLSQVWFCYSLTVWL